MHEDSEQRIVQKILFSSYIIVVLAHWSCGHVSINERQLCKTLLCLRPFPIAWHEDVPLILASLRCQSIFNRRDFVTSIWPLLCSIESFFWMVNNFHITSTGELRLSDYWVWLSTGRCPRWRRMWIWHFLQSIKEKKESSSSPTSNLTTWNGRGA